MVLPCNEFLFIMLKLWMFEVRIINLKKKFLVLGSQQYALTIATAFVIEEAAATQ